jgi:hypothetical protein
MANSKELQLAVIETAIVNDLNVSGEYKRHVVYAKLIKAFPSVSKRVLSMALEQAVARLPH